MIDIWTAARFNADAADSEDLTGYVMSAAATVSESQGGWVL